MGSHRAAFCRLRNLLHPHVCFALGIDSFGQSSSTKRCPVRALDREGGEKGYKKQKTRREAGEGGCYLDRGVRLWSQWSRQRAPRSRSMNRRAFLRATQLGEPSFHCFMLFSICSYMLACSCPRHVLGLCPRQRIADRPNRIRLASASATRCSSGCRRTAICGGMSRTICCTSSGNITSSAMHGRVPRVCSSASCTCGACSRITAVQCLVA